MTRARYIELYRNLRQFRSSFIEDGVRFVCYPDPMSYRQPVSTPVMVGIIIGRMTEARSRLDKRRRIHNALTSRQWPSVRLP